jgi:hypothetical protein
MVKRFDVQVSIRDERNILLRSFLVAKAHVDRLQVHRGSVAKYQLDHIKLNFLRKQKIPPVFLPF